MNRQHRFGLLLSAAEKQVLKRLAEMEGGLSQAAMLRRLIHKAGRERGLWLSGQSQDDQQTQEAIE